MTEPGPLAPAATSREFFERLYGADPDPWGFAEDAYEQARYARLLEHVPAGRYRTVFEPGCSVGVLTVELALRCERVLAVDIAERAVSTARERCRSHPGVDVRRGGLAEALPDEPVDLIVLSEVGYYLTEPVLAAVAGRMAALLTPGGRLVAGHWTGSSPDHVLHGRAVHRILGAHLPLVHRGSTEHRWTRDAAPGPTGHDEAAKAFVLDVWDLPS